LKKLKQGKELENLESLENSEEEENQSERKVSSYKWIFLAIFIAFLAFFFYNPSPAEMW
jgi:hypothetical protein